MQVGEGTVYMCLEYESEEMSNIFRNTGHQKTEDCLKPEERHHADSFEESCVCCMCANP